MSGDDFPGGMLATFEQLLSVEKPKLEGQVRIGIRDRKAETTLRGVLGSGRAHLLIVVEAANSVPVFAQTAYSLFTRCMTAYDVAFTPENLRSAEQLLGNEIVQWTNQMNSVAKSSVPSAQSAAISNALSMIDEKGGLEKDRISGELRLLFASEGSRASKQSSGAQSMTFNAPVGVVQTGAGSYAIAHQHIDEGAKTALVQSLAALQTALEHANDLPFNKGEIRELIIDAQNEAKSAKPNTSKIRALVTGVGNAIMLAPRLKEAYDALKYGASLAGIQLP